ncbi:hypothetical protein ANCCAN_11796 [Ancylostoma caninum]|uniref:DDE Tnp4 domain-containing protein n=1 Tax=Ancylostoma caninum TaxID=29170 RepID=A0A368GGW6_ANCCA|nr:hypothetical protein ANCCAN_11796 [Ancylostoma caninum]
MISSELSNLLPALEAVSAALEYMEEDSNRRRCYLRPQHAPLLCTRFLSMNIWRRTIPRGSNATPSLYLKRFLDSNDHLFPPRQTLGNVDGIQYHVLVDGGFGQAHRYVRPYTEPMADTGSKRRFNTKHSGRDLSSRSQSSLINCFQSEKNDRIGIWNSCPSI